MNIRLKGNLAITTDSNQFILNRVAVNKKTSEEYLQGIGFYGSLEQALEAYTKAVILQSDATSVKDLLDELTSVKQYLKEQVGI